MNNNESRSDWLAERPAADSDFPGYDLLAPLPPFTGCAGCEAGCFECTPPF